MTAESSYLWLKKHFADVAYLFSAAELCAWDQRTYIPPNGHRHRSSQMEALARMIHQRSTDKKIDEHLSSLEGSSFLNDAETNVQTNVRMWRREFERQTKIPETLASALAHASSSGEAAWEVAVKNNDWDSFFPHLEKLIALNKEKAMALGFEKEPYDGLLDEYEIGLKVSTVKTLFEELKSPLVDLLQQINNSSVKLNGKLFHGDFPIEKQRSLCRELVSAIGYDMSNGRIDEAVHPFSVGIGPGDSRITTRYSQSYLGSGIFGCLHEAGHSLYELGLPAEAFGTPAGMFVSLGIHESQSRFWENLIGRSAAFWKFARKSLDREFSVFNSTSLEELMLSVNEVSPGLIRVEADEVTYNLHVLIRFELELALFQNQIDAKELPELWADKMDSYLGVRPKSYQEGVMQDVHWSAGMFGYFPTYTLGNIYSAQLYAAAQKQIEHLDGRIEQGEFSELLQWLRMNIHRHGQTFLPHELIANATGEPPSSDYFISYCTEKYKMLYRL